MSKNKNYEKIGNEVSKKLQFDKNRFDNLHKIRKDQYIALFEICSKNSKWAAQGDDQKHRQIRRIERSCYNSACYYCINGGHPRTWNDKLFLIKYQTECSEMYSSLEINNGEIAEKLSKGELNPINLCEISSQELHPQVWQEDVENIKMRNTQKVEEKVSTTHKCRKCGQKRATITRYQARSLDEPETIKYNCLECGNQWNG